MEPTDSFDVLNKALLIEDKDTRIQTLRTLIESGVDVNSCWNGGYTSIMMFEYEGLTVLMVAARYGYVDCVQLLLNAGAKVNQSDYVGEETALIEAASRGNIECMKILLGAGADVDQSNVIDETALTRAASNGHDKYVRLLIKAGVNVNHSDERGQTALIITAKFGYFKCMELLLEAGTNVNGVDINGNTLLIRFLNCFSNSNKSKVCLNLLIDAGVDIDTRNNNNLQPVHYALKLWKRATFPVEYLISENCNLSQASYDLVKEVCCIYAELKEKDRLDILKLLFACGLPRHLCQTFIVEKDASIKNWWVETVASQPNTLKSICVFKIRRNLGLGIKSKVTKLNLPNVIQNLILLKGILSSECFD